MMGPMEDRTIEQVEEFAIQVFGNREKAIAWLNEASGPGEITSRQILASPEGRESVWQALVQIDEGIFM